MQQFLEFASNHAILFIALGVVAALLIHNLWIGNKGSVDAVTATDLINRRDAVVVDVRPTADFGKGHIINAINIPINGFASQIGTLAKHKEKPIIVNCRSGAQSTAASKLLRKNGFGEVYNLQGGILAWQSANLPITRK